MARLIPKKTKVQTQFYKNYTIPDAILAFVFLILIALVALSGFKILVKGIVAGSLVLTFIILMISTQPDTRMYQSLGYLFRYLFGRRVYRRTKLNTSKSITSLMPYSGVLDNGMIDYKDYYASVLEIMPVEYYMLTEERQNAFINAVDNAIKTMSTEQTALIVKTQRPMVLDNFIANEEKKREAVKKALEEGEMSQQEFDGRVEIINTRIAGLEACNVDTDKRLMKDHYYLVLFGSNRTSLLGGMQLIANTIESGTNGSLQSKILNQKETAVFLKTTYFDDVDEREINNIEPKDFMDWIMPDSIKFNASSYAINNKLHKIYSVADYPLSVRNAWGNAFFNINASKVVVKFTAVPQGEAEKRLDKSIMEMEIQAQKRAKASVQIEKDTHLQTLQELMVSLKNGNEVLFDVNLFIDAQDQSKKEVRTMLRRASFKFDEMFGSQKDAFINANITQRSTLKRMSRGINSSSLAAIFPFISDAVQDPTGIFIGYNTEPFFIDMFLRNKDRVNSNMIVLGKSGSGKSYATKGLLAHLASDNTRVFVLDPEKEYVRLAKNLGGKVVDVGSAKEGRINPFHIVTSLEDEGDAGQNVSLQAHMQFLEEFFKIILDGITKDALEVLNECVKELYAEFKITERTDISKLKANQFPIFQDLFKFVTKKYDQQKDEFMKNNLRVIRTYLIKFAEGGRNANLWNGYSTISAKENFIVFQFQTLLANKNDDITNAQMLLIMRWLENEVFKNKDYNEMHNTKRKVVVAIDEAHVFIDPKKPVALDFMFQLAKRIRKYEGMQIVISQNIKDFVGSPDIARKSTAIINASQFSMIFALAPNDINDLVSLYEKSGEINESEQESIVANQRGHTFFITGPYSRTNVEVIYADNVAAMFEKQRISDDGKFITESEMPENKEKLEKEEAEKLEQEDIDEIELDSQSLETEQSNELGDQSTESTDPVEEQKDESSNMVKPSSKNKK